MIEIEEAGVERVDELVAWRMAVLREVFSLGEDSDVATLEAANRAYYEREIPKGGHIACFALLDGEVVGCGGVCLQREMPSPDNPNGRCAYLMNIYTRPAARGRDVGTAIVNWLVGRAEKMGAGKVYLETSKAGRRLYEKAGFADLPGMMKLADD